MPNKRLFIKELIRSPMSDESDKLVFTKGVNLIIGQPNTGKTQWLRMLDYLWGDTGTPKDAFDEELVQKYDSITANVEIGGEEYVFERRWKERGSIGKVFVNDVAVLCSDFSPFLLGLLDLPTIHVPSGNPYSARRWPHLSWRELYRHIYRRQESWSDIAARQPPSTQHSCLLYFLGIAEKLHSNLYSNLVDLNKEISGLEYSQKQIGKLLDQISAGIINDDEVGIFVTSESIRSAIKKLNVKIEDISMARNKIIEDLESQSMDSISLSQNEFDKLNSRIIELTNEKNEIQLSLSESLDKINELNKYMMSVEEEYARMQRTLEAGSVFGDIKITHCPACNQSITQHDEVSTCFLCKQETHTNINNSAPNSRIEFEIAQLDVEKQEAHEIYNISLQEHAQRLEQSTNINRLIEDARIELAPLIYSISKNIPPDLTIYDTEIGRSREKISILEKIGQISEMNLLTVEKVASLTLQRSLIESEIDQLQKSISFSEASKDISNYMNFYLNVDVRRSNAASWNQGQIIAEIKKNSFDFVAGEKSWTKLGGTMLLYFLAAYNYSLLRLTFSDDYRYPGLTIIDMPAKFSDTQITRDQAEVRVITPFVKIKSQTGNSDYQVIITGSQFYGLENVNRIDLSNVWK
jgi:hypothetical protein